MRLKGLTKERSVLPPIKNRNILNYRDRRYPEGSDSRALADSAFGNWQEYLNGKNNSNEDIISKDVTFYISLLENKGRRSSTIENYLGILVPFFKHETLLQVAEYTKAKKKDYHIKAMAERKYVPMRSEDLMALYKLATKEEDKVLIRLLLMEKIPIHNIAEICVSQKANHEYAFSYGDRKLELSKETVEAAVPLIQKNNLKGRERLFKFTNRRLISEHMKILNARLDEEKNPGYDVYAKSLRRYGKGIHKDDLNSWLCVGQP